MQNSFRLLTFAVSWNQKVAFSVKGLPLAGSLSNNLGNTPCNRICIMPPVYMALF